MMTGRNDFSLEELKTLHEVSRRINSHRDLKTLLEETMDLAVELLHAEKGLILLREEGAAELKVHVARAADRKTIQMAEAMSRSVIASVDRLGKPRLVRNDPRTRQDLSESVVRFGISSLVCVPLWEKGSLIGVIYLDTTDPNHFFDEDEIPFLEAFANLAAVAIDNARSYEEVRKLNAGLEDQVLERTQELRRKHEELARAYEDLRETQLQLVRSEKMASLGLLVAGVAHEINTPLGAINSSSDTLRRGVAKLKSLWVDLSVDGSAEDSVEVTRTLKVVEDVSQATSEACRRIDQVVRALRAFARLDEEDFKQVDIHDGLEAAWAVIRGQYEGRVDLVRKYGQVPLLKCRAAQLNQVFLNLLLNACQAIPNRGEISILTQARGGRLEIQVQDNGTGILPEHLPKIFDPGFTTRGVKFGTGLGLSIAYQIVKDHGGDIRVVSTPGEGATVTVDLPHQNAEQPDPRRTQAAPV
ncbi:MAG: ATP-binding protein [Acidobacteriota bacterium]